MDVGFFIANNKEFLIFVLFLAIFLIIKRKNIEIQGKYPHFYIMMFKTKLGLDKMKLWSEKNPNLFKYLSYFSIFIGITGIIISTIYMVWGLNFVYQNQLEAGGGFVLPIKTESGLSGAVPIFYVPFWYFIVALFVLAIVHEFAHGVIAQRWGIKIKSSGFAFFGSAYLVLILLITSIYSDFQTSTLFDMTKLVLFGALFFFIPIMPGAFVEPDEKDIKKKTWWQQIAVFGAGSASNFLTGALFLVLIIFAINPVIDNTMEYSSLSFSSVSNKSELLNYNITSGQILSLDSVTEVDKIFENLLNTTPNQTLNMTILDQNNLTQNVLITTFENPQNSQKGMVGISGLKTDLIPKEEYSLLGKFPLYIQELFRYIALLNIGIGLVNLLPLWITDGGQITYTLLKRKFNEKLSAKLFNIISFFSLTLIILTIWPALLMKVIEFISNLI